MIDLVMLQVVRDVVAILGVIIAFSYYIIILRNQNTSRNAARARKFLRNEAICKDLRWTTMTVKGNLSEKDNR